MSSPPTSPTPSPCPAWTIQPVTHSAIHEVATFINKARRSLFPNLKTNSAAIPNDIVRSLKRGVFLTARATSTTQYGDNNHNNHNNLIAVIGYVPYDHRFPQLSFHGRKTVEVIRLFVVPEYRRYGLAAALFQALKERAEENGVQCLYLHTHPFLPGAIRFWEKMGFWIRDVEDDPVWRTTHMQMLLEEEAEEEEAP